GLQTGIGSREMVGHPPAWAASRFGPGNQGNKPLDVPSPENRLRGKAVLQAPGESAGQVFRHLPAKSRLRPFQAVNPEEQEIDALCGGCTDMLLGLLPIV